MVIDKLVKESQEEISTLNLFLTAFTGFLRVANEYHIVRYMCAFVSTNVLE